MRSTTDLIVELEEESKKHWVVVMAVGFEDSTIFVSPVHKDRLALLNFAIQEGGIPVGMIAADKFGNRLEMRTTVYPEHQDSAEFDAEGYLSDLTHHIGKALAAA
jgi:hypothetical protein